MSTQTATTPSLTLKRRLKASPAKVFAAWTDPEKVKRWMGPGEVKTVSAECDARVGGRYRWLMQAPNGEQYGVGGVYREVIPNEKHLEGREHGFKARNILLHSELPALQVASRRGKHRHCSLKR